MSFSYFPPGQNPYAKYGLDVAISVVGSDGIPELDSTGIPRLLGWNNSWREYIAIEAIEGTPLVYKGVSYVTSAEQIPATMSGRLVVLIKTSVNFTSEAVMEHEALSEADVVGIKDLLDGLAGQSGSAHEYSSQSLPQPVIDGVTKIFNDFFI
jgi:hypothetical protein